MNVVECTTYYRRYRHYSTNMQPQDGAVGEIGSYLLARYLLRGTSTQ
jgi:hypothetical protein